MLQVTEFRHDLDREFICEWLKDHGLSVSMADQLPEWGFIAFLKTEPVAASFLRRMENANIALVDSLISNPNLSKRLGHQGLDLVIEACKKKAKQMGLSGLMAHVGVTLSRAKKHGFKEIEQSLVTLNLKGEN